MRRILLLLACLVGVPGLAAAQTGNPLHDQLSGMNESTRRAEVFRAITGGGASCQAIIATYFAGFDQGRTAYWDMRCREGSMYRIALPAQRFARLGLSVCGALGGGIAAGPCFQPVGTAAPSMATSGTGVQLAVAQEPALPANSRFGAVYATDAPMAAFGFGNGAADRLAVNTTAVRSCQSMAGRVPCKFLGEIVNRCGALVQAVSRHPNAVVMTSDLSTMVLNRNFPGVGATVQEAEAQAMQACRSSPGATCRIAASGC
ncbi:DUF4189 domain-containing protein [Falsiroseomonas selenitidurans]|uniref:DUF4189 domain-containing protein n=1 Tax=Falsiroseomonas selenitidurans TaxID=2716335 RepID=A0ABX1DXR4_9PROT|nr:DUF4189 domain-containing protein [Falsiroseomonas selenitidurans]NKC29661.1 DUF4189 domain-containing protein [Falsiroseomonas selenitidurans]